MPATDDACAARRGFALLLTFLALAAAGKTVLYDTLDPDCFWHLRVAAQLQAEGIHPLVDRLSFSSSATPWTPYSWLAELGMKFLWDHAGGYRAAIAVQSLCVAAFVLLVGFTCRAYAESAEEPRYFAAILATAAATFLALPYLSFRPVTFAIVLLTLVAWLLVTDRQLEERTRRAWLIPPITVLLTNVHLFAFFVPLFLFALLCGSVWETWGRRGVDDGRRMRRYALLTAASALAYLCTPLLPGVLQTVAHYQFNDVMVRGPVIAEFQPFYRGTMGVLSAILVAAMLTCALLRCRSIRCGEWLWLAGTFVLLLKMGRFAPLFAIIGAPIFAATLPRLSDRVLMRRPLQAAVAALCAIGLCRIILSFPTNPNGLDTWLNHLAPTSAAYPTGAAAYVQQSLPRTTGRIVNEFNWGGYLGWRLGEQVLLDGRTQVYSANFWRATYLGSETDRRRLLSGVRADAAILPVKGSTFRMALARLGWRPVFADAYAEVLIPPAEPIAAVEP